MSPSAATRVEWSRRLAQALVSAGQLSEEQSGQLLEESTSERGVARVAARFAGDRHPPGDTHDPRPADAAADSRPLLQPALT